MTNALRYLLHGRSSWKTVTTRGRSSSLKLKEKVTLCLYLYLLLLKRSSFLAVTARKMNRSS